MRVDVVRVAKARGPMAFQPIEDEITHLLRICQPAQSRAVLRASVLGRATARRFDFNR